MFSIDVTECPDCGGQIRRALDPFIVRRMKETHTYVTREQFTPSRDKATRARAIQGRMSMGKVYLSADASWTGELVTELMKFPFGKHDDQVDVLSLFGMMLDKLHGRSVRKPKERPYIGTGQYVLDQLEAMDALHSIPPFGHRYFPADYFFSLLFKKSCSTIRITWDRLNSSTIGRAPLKFR